MKNTSHTFPEVGSKTQDQKVVADHLSQTRGHSFEYNEEMRVRKTPTYAAKEFRYVLARV